MKSHVRADGKGLDLIVNFDPETPKQLCGDFGLTGFFFIG